MKRKIIIPGILLSGMLIVATPSSQLFAGPVKDKVSELQMQNDTTKMHKQKRMMDGDTTKMHKDHKQKKDDGRGYHKDA